MTDLAKLRELLERVEKVEGQDYETDCSVAVLLDGWNYLTTNDDYKTTIWHPEREMLPSYTSSIDAVVALAERVLPGCQRMNRKSKDAGGIFYASYVNMEHWEQPISGQGANDALAIVAAIIRAKIAELEAPE